MLVQVLFGSAEVAVLLKRGTSEYARASAALLEPLALAGVRPRAVALCHVATRLLISSPELSAWKEVSHAPASQALALALHETSRSGGAQGGGNTERMPT